VPAKPAPARRSASLREIPLVGFLVILASFLVGADSNPDPTAALGERLGSE
jgi:hypothetical protein